MFKSQMQRLEFQIEMILSNFFFYLGVYFESCHKNIKFVDFCGKFYLPLLQFLCSPACTSTPTFQMTSSDSDDNTDDIPTKDMSSKFKKVLLG